MSKLRWTFYLICFFFILSPKRAFAQVVINKFYSAEASDWVEIYNTGAPIDTSSLAITDNAGHVKIFPQCSLQTNGSYVIDWPSTLNNPGDRIGLTKNSQLVDCVSYGDGPICDGKTIVDLTPLSVGQYAVRQPAGTGAWTKTSDASRSDNSQCLAISPTSVPPTATPAPTHTPTLTPVPKGTYKINKTKDGTGTELSSVKIYVDDKYIGHEDNETLTFCSGCHCNNDKNVDCGFGQHKISMQKDGYQNWEETKTINAGDSFEVNPVMGLTPSSAPTPSFTLTLTPTKKTTPTPTLASDLSSESNVSSTTDNQTLGEQTSNDNSDILNLSRNGEVADKPFSNENKEISSLSKRGSDYIFPGAAVFVGLGFVGFSIFSFLRTNKKIE